MEKNPESFGNIINIQQILIGLIVLLLGTLVYLVDRSPDQTYFVHRSFVNISLHNTLPNLFGCIGNNLPSFIHVFSFTLITAGIISYNKKQCIIVCGAWFLIDSLFEAGQKYTALVLKIIPNWSQHIPFMENSKNYFLRGTFDYFDLAAIIAGCLTGYCVLILTIKKGY